MVTAKKETTFGTPVPIDDSSSESSVHKDNEIAGDDYHLLPLNFDEPDDTDMLEPFPLEMLPAYYANAYMIPISTAIAKPPFDMDHGDVSVKDAHNTEEICSKYEIMSVGSADDHMISSDDSVGYLAMDLPIHA
jgi:hypothetical protein